MVGKYALQHLLDIVPQTNVPVQVVDIFHSIECYPSRGRKDQQDDELDDPNWYIRPLEPDLLPWRHFVEACFFAI